MGKKQSSSSALSTLSTLRSTRPLSLLFSTSTPRTNTPTPITQATVGDVEGSQPWAVQMEARAKWDAWNSVKGMPKEEAMKQYAH